MRILVISSFLPFPLYSGGHVRLYNLLKEISKKHKITLVCEKRDYQTENDIKEIRNFCEEVITVKRQKQWSWQNILLSGFSTLPFLLVGHKSQEMKNKIVELLINKTFDLIHIETFYVFHNLPKTYLPTVLVEHNIEYEVYSKYAKTASMYLRPLLLLDIEKIKKWEKYYWQKATKLVVVSEDEKSSISRKDVVLVPNGVDILAFPFKKKLSVRKEKRILFMGDFKWIQNITAAKMILQKIWPQITNQLQNEKVILWIVGKNIPQDIKSMGDKSVIFDENAPDETSKIYQRADILLSPITVGGGTSYKILESMASGVPVVTTPLGVIGIGAKDKKEALVGETEEVLTQHVILLLSDTGLYNLIRENARKLIESKYSWPTIAKELEKVYENVVQEK